MNQKYFYLLYLLLFNCAAFAQSIPSVEWSYKFGATKSDAFHSVLQNKKGELVAVGHITTSKKNQNILLVKINPKNGSVSDYTKELGGPEEDFASQIIQTITGDYIIIGSTGNKARKNAFIMQVDDAGIEGWKTMLKSTEDAIFHQVVQNSKGDLYVVGQVGKKACLLKYTSTGDLLRREDFDMDGTTAGLAIELTAEEDIIIAIHQKKKKHHSTILQRIHNDSISVWQHSFPNIEVMDLWVDVEKIAATGTLYSTKKEKIEDLFLLTLGLDGQDMNRNDQIRPRGRDGGHALVRSRDGTYYAAGYNTSFDLNVHKSKLWVSKMNESGAVIQPEYYIEGGKSTDVANDIIELPDGSLIVAGQSQSGFGDSKKGAWLMRLHPEGYGPILASIEQANLPDKQVRDTIIITWLNKLDVKGGYIYQAYQQFVNMRLRAISPRPLDKVEFSVTLNNPKEESKAKSDPVKIGKKQTGEHEFDLDPFQLSLKLGLNTVYVKGDGVLLDTFLIDYTPSTPNLHVVSIGIPYDNDLEYTSKDARDFANLFATLPTGKDRLFNPVVEIDTLTTKAATREGDINAKISELSEKEVKPNDYLFLFISAHGMEYEDDFLIPASDYIRKDINAIKFKEHIIDKLQHLNCKKIIFIDACHSGGAKSIINSNSEALQIITQAENDFYIMTSSSASQQSFENKEWENGAFTKALREAFTNKKVEIEDGKWIQANTNDAYLTLAELYEFIKKRVAYLTQTKNKTQTPSINKGLSELKIPVFQSGTTVPEPLGGR